MANPGRGWVVVRSHELSAGAIVDALAGGEFYASTGVELDELEVSDKEISLTVRRSEPTPEHIVYGTSFIGRDGVILAQTEDAEATYRIRGDEGYVRATVVSSSGVKAWTQPVFVR